MRSSFVVLASILALGTLVPAAPAAAQAGSPAGAIPVETLARRRVALLDSIGTGVAILRSAEEKSIEGDYPQDSDFRQDNDFFYLTGLETTGSWLVLVARDTAPDRVMLFLPPRNPGQERWTGPKLGPDSAATVMTGIEEVHSADSVDRLLRPLMFGFNSPARTGGLYLKLDEKTGRDEKLREMVFGGPGFDVHDLRTVLGQLRVIKDADEVTRMRRAIDITADAQRAAMRAAKPGMYEYQLEAVIEGTFRGEGAERVGFPSIIGSGVNSTVLHYDKNRRKTEAGDLVVMDIGAEFGYYSADVTRTVPITGKFSARQRDIYNLVLATQQAAIDSVRPGTTVGALNRIARNYMKEHSGSLCGDKTCDSYFIHGLSHWLGMDVHDIGDYSTPLMPGMVLTVEPGIYLSEENLGVRIEDDVLVTADGHDLLSAKAPRSVKDIEQAMK